MALMRVKSSRHRFVVLTPSCFSRAFLLCGFVLFVLFLVSFCTGPSLVLHPGPLPDPTSEGSSTYKDKGAAINKSIMTSTVIKHPVTVGSKTNLAILDTSDSIWKSKLSKNFYGCSIPSQSFMRQSLKFKSNGYLLVEASGGLNQQRTGIIDAVVVANILNATLVIPHLDHASFWGDNSNFSDIFDVDWFITTLKPYVAIIKELPSHIDTKIVSVRVPRKCIPDYYRRRVLPVLKKNKVIRLTKFDYRLSNRLDEDLQKLRCRVNYHALRFTEAIDTIGNNLVQRIRQKKGRYIALHLRFEPDMLAFSGCYYGGGEKEIKELGSLRKRWKNIHHRNPDRERRNGRCPLTPEEVGLMLRALGFQSDSYLYVASGEVYGGDSTLAPLKRLFPNYYTKDALATEDELSPFSHHSSQLAAIDFIVCDSSDVFVTNNNGNMARMLAGRRRYFGHKRTIRSNAKKLWSLFINRQNMTWDAFATRLRKLQRGFMGEPLEMRPGRGQFFENPSVCICDKSKEKVQETQHENVKDKYMPKDVVDEENSDQELPDNEDDNNPSIDEDIDLDENPWLSD